METSGVLPTRSIFDVNDQIERELREAERPERERAIEHERRWYGRPEAMIREEMEQAVRRRHPDGVTWPHFVRTARKRTG
jgi:hypothetical protein